MTGRLNLAMYLCTCSETCKRDIDRIVPSPFIHLPLYFCLCILFLCIEMRLFSYAIALAILSYSFASSIQILLRSFRCSEYRNIGCLCIYSFEFIASCSLQHLSYYHATGRVRKSLNCVAIQNYTANLTFSSSDRMSSVRACSFCNLSASDSTPCCPAPSSSGEAE